MQHFYKHLADTAFVPADIFEKMKVTKVEKETMPRPVWHVHYEYAGAAYHYNENGETGNCINSSHPTSKEKKDTLARIPTKQRNAIVVGCLFLVAGVVLCIMASAAVYPYCRHVTVLSILLMGLAVVYPFVLHRLYEKEKDAVTKIAHALRHNGMCKMPGMGGEAKCKVPVSASALHNLMARVGAMVMLLLCVLGLFTIINLRVGTPRANEKIKNVPQFMGIPINGSESMFCRQLKKIGFEWDGVYEGYRQWGWGSPLVRAEKMNGKICRVVVRHGNTPSSSSSAIDEFNDIVEEYKKNSDYTLQYGNTLSGDHQLIISLDEGKEYKAGFRNNVNNTVEWVRLYPRSSWDTRFFVEVYYENPNNM